MLSAIAKLYRASNIAAVEFRPTSATLCPTNFFVYAPSATFRDMNFSVQLGIACIVAQDVVTIQPCCAQYCMQCCSIRVLTVRLTQHLRNGFQSSFEIPKVCYALGDFIM